MVYYAHQHTFHLYKPNRKGLMYTPLSHIMSPSTIHYYSRITKFPLDKFVENSEGGLGQLPVLQQRNSLSLGSLSLLFRVSRIALSSSD